jgi:hypothetical protein
LLDWDGAEIVIVSAYSEGVQAVLEKNDYDQRWRTTNQYNARRNAEIHW